MKKAKKIIAVILAILTVFSTTSFFSVSVSAAGSSSARTIDDICVYSQWDYDVYKDNWMPSSSCGWMALAHGIQWLGLEPKDKEEVGYKPLPFQYYLASGYRSNKGISVSSTAISFLKNSYPNLIAEDKSTSSLKNALKAGKVSTLLSTWSEGGHYTLAVELSPDEQYVHVVDSCLIVQWNHFSSYIYKQNADGSFSKVPKTTAGYSQINAKDIKWYWTKDNNGNYSMKEATSTDPAYSGGDYWVPYSFASARAQVYLSVNTQDELQYLDFFPANGTIKVSILRSSTVKSLPYSKESNPNSVDVDSATGKTFPCTGFYRNSAGNYWYKVKTSSGAVGYVYSGDVSSFTSSSDLTITNQSTPQALIQGKTFSTKGHILTNNRLLSITASVTSADKSSTLFTKTVDVSSMSQLHFYDISTPPINDAMTFRQLANGSYRYIITVKYGYYTVPSSGTPKQTTASVELINAAFTVSTTGSSGTDTTDDNVKQYNATANTSVKGLYYVSSTTPLRDIPAESGNIIRSMPKGTVVEIVSSGENLVKGHIWYKTADGLYLWPYVDSTLRLHKITAPFYFEYATANKTNASLYICNSINLNPYVTSATCKNLTHIGIIIYTKSGSTYKQVASAYETLTSTSTTQAKAWYNVSPTLESGNTVLKDSSGNRYVFTPGNTYYYKMYVEYDYNNTCLKTDSQNFADDSGYFSFVAPVGSACVHNVTELRNVVAATCTTAGYSGDKYCLSCGIKVSNGSTIAPLEHDLSTVSVDATCTTSGYVEYSCLRCEYSSRTVIPETGHIHVEIRNAKAATCSATGYTGDTYCTDCGTKISSGSTIAKTAHTVVTDKAVGATCTTAGKTAGSHCSVCGLVITAQTTVPATGHQHTEVRNAKTATCSATGYTGDTYCTDCGTKISSGSTIAKTAHTVVNDAAVGATCTTAGKTAGSHCSVCGTVITAQTTVPATGHQHTEVRNAKAATCSATGYTGDTYCTDCGTKISSGSTIAKKAHTVVTDKAVAATCTTAGKTAGSHCSVCGTVITAQTTVAALGHNYVAVVTAPTATAQGYTTHTCSRCNDSYVDSYTDPVKPSSSLVITVPSVKARKGDEVAMEVTISGNPGISVLWMTVQADSALTFVGATNAALFGTLDVGNNLLFSSDYNTTANGTLVTLRFKVSDTAAEGDHSVTLRFLDASDDLGTPYTATVNAGKVTVSNVVYGDVNGDGKISAADLALLRRYLADLNVVTGISTVTLQAGADANGDGKINASDLALLRRYLAEFDVSTGKSTVVLGPRV